MIIVCNNCSKKFKIDSSLIPEKGRLLECNFCHHRWFFKNDEIKETIISEEINLPIKEPIIQNNKTHENIDFLNKEINKDFINEKNQDKDRKITESKDEKNYNILGFIIVFIISFIALIIVLDTFTTPISKLIPNIEFILYNLYETINDIGLFIKDLI